MSAEVLLPFGMRADGRLVPVRDVERGIACGCICPQCRTPLVARQGDRNQHHFAHASAAPCYGARETMLHRVAKQILVDERRIFLSGISIEHRERARVIRKGFWLDAASAEPEVSVQGLRPDVLMCAGNGDRLAIEIFVAHKVPPEKIVRLKEIGLDTIEIDLSEEIRESDPDAIRDIVLEGSYRRWLFNAEADAARPKAIADIEREIERDLRKQNRSDVAAEAFRRLRAYLSPEQVLSHLLQYNNITGMALSASDVRYIVDWCVQRHMQANPHYLATAQRLASQHVAVDKTPSDEEIKTTAEPTIKWDGSRSGSGVPIESWLRVARMRPEIWVGSGPFAGCFCAACNSESFENNGSEWRCTKCAPEWTAQEKAA